MSVIPSHVRDFDAFFLEPNDVSLEHRKPLDIRALLAALEQKLVTDTDTKKRFISLNPLSDWFNQSEAFQFRHAISKRALPGEEQV